MTTTAVLLRIGRGLLKSATPLDWTTRAALPDYADRRRRTGRDYDWALFGNRCFYNNPPETYTDTVRSFLRRVTKQ
jgi:hypothetical protein